MSDTILLTHDKVKKLKKYKQKYALLIPIFSRFVTLSFIKDKIMEDDREIQTNTSKLNNTKLFCAKQNNVYYVCCRRNIN